MAVSPYRGKFHIEWYPVTTSTAFAVGDMVTILNTVAGVGTLAKVVDGSTRVLGTIQKKITSADADYATARKVPVLVGDADAEWLATAAGTAAATDVGEMVGFDDEVTVDVTDYTEGQFLITGVISSTLVTGKFNKGFGLEIPITQ